MLIKNSQQDIEIKLPDIKHIGLKISGGADSAILCYMLAKYIHEEHNNLTIVPLTIVQPVKPYQEIFAKRVIDYCKDRFGNVFGEHHVIHSTDITSYVGDHRKILEIAYDNNIIFGHAMGITAPPPRDVCESWYYPLLI